jgi:hypothetical protein
VLRGVRADAALAEGRASWSSWHRPNLVASNGFIIHWLGETGIPRALLQVTGSSRDYPCQRWGSVRQLRVSDDTVRGWIDNDPLIAGQDDFGRTVIAGDVLADFWRGRQRTGSPQSSDLCGDAAVGELHGGYRKRFKEIMSLSRAGRATPSSNQGTERP